MNRIGAGAGHRGRVHLALIGALVVAVAVAAGLAAWLATRGGSRPTMPILRPSVRRPIAPSPARVAPIGPLIVTEAGAKDAAGSLGGPVYWVGPQAGRRYELRRTAAGDVFVRYLPTSAKPGDPHAFTTVATYPFADAYSATRALAHGPDSVSERVEGWLAVYRTSQPTTIYLAAPGFPYQIEVYDPSAARARTLVESGDVGPVP